MDVRALASLHAFPRVGFVIPKYKHSGVERNRLKRRLREIVRIDVLSGLAPMDLVVRVLPVAYDRPFDLLRAEVLQAVRRVHRQVEPLAPPPAASSAVAPPVAGP